MFPFFSILPSFEVPLHSRTAQLHPIMASQSFRRTLLRLYLFAGITRVSAFPNTIPTATVGVNILLAHGPQIELLPTINPRALPELFRRQAGSGSQVCGYVEGDISESSHCFQISATLPGT